jgi:hypothetical protein
MIHETSGIFNQLTRLLALDLLTYLLAELSPSWEAADCAAIQEIPRNPKVHHSVHKCPPLVPILSQFDPAREDYFIDYNRGDSFRFYSLWFI